MATATRTTSSDPLLASVRGLCDEEARVQVDKLAAVVAWAEANDASHAEWLELTDPAVEPALHLAGPGAPCVPEYAALDLALSLGMSTDGGFRYLARALELCHRLPRLYRRVTRLEVPVWKAFRIAEQTIALTEAAAWHVDRHIAPVADRCTFAQIDRTIASAVIEHDPETAEARRLAALESRKVTVYLGDPVADGTGATVEVQATLDVADAIDLEHALRDGAQTLADLGSAETLDVRRAQALGEMARHQLALDLDTSSTGAGRGVMLYAHLDAEHPDAGGILENTLTPVLIDQIREWCSQAGTRVTIKPVIDLNETLATDAYRPTEVIREHVTLRDRCCVYPGCGRRRVDLDHIHPYDTGGPTATTNLAMLCRRHHRAKTHGGWTYRMLTPGLHEWTSPSGVTTYVDRRPPPGTRARRHP